MPGRRSLLLFFFLYNKYIEKKKDKTKAPEIPYLALTFGKRR